jgi:hypothetical protein
MIQPSFNYGHQRHSKPGSGAVWVCQALQVQ